MRFPNRFTLGINDDHAKVEAGSQKPQVRREPLTADRAREVSPVPLLSSGASEFSPLLSTVTCSTVSRQRGSLLLTPVEHPSPRRGFTLTEMLVVCGIIVVLISILIPATVAARNRARMATCASNLRQIGAGIFQYASDNRGYYPSRPINAPAGIKPNQILIWGVDIRVPLNAYIDWNRLSCPFAPRPLNYTNITGYSDVEWTYELWLGWQYQVPYNGVNEKGAFKVGRPFTFQGKSFSILASDEQYDQNTAVNGSNFVSEGEHPTTGMDVLDYTMPENGSPGDYFTRWNNTTTQRGPVDLNFLWNDGSVSTISRIPMNYWVAGPTFRPDVAAVDAYDTENQAWLVPLPSGH